MKKKWTNPIIHNHGPYADTPGWSGAGSAQGSTDPEVFWGYEEWGAVYDWPDFDGDGEEGTWDDYVAWVQWYNNAYGTDEEPLP